MVDLAEGLVAYRLCSISISCGDSITMRIYNVGGDKLFIGSGLGPVLMSSSKPLSSAFPALLSPWKGG